MRSWWKALLHRQRAENDVETEIRFHIESYAADLMRSGVEREEALRRAKAELGSVAAQKDEWRASIGLRAWDDLRGDVRYAFRQLRGAPGFTLTVVLVLALGIGANAAMFSVVDATLLRWLPYSRPSEILILNTADAKGVPGFASYADFEEWRQQTRSLSSVACYLRNSAYIKTSADDQMVSAPTVSADFFTVLGTAPAMGRGFIADEQIPGKGQVVVLSDRAWRSLLGSDPDIVGKQVAVNNVPYTVVGVMPPRFAFPIDDPTTQVWLPVEATANHHLRNFSTPPCQAIGRMQKGASIQAAQAELSSIQQRLAPLYGKENVDLAPSRVDAVRYRDTLVKDARPALRALLLAVAIIWLIACANVANLMLARGMARQREIAVRGALGASRWRLLRQLITESLILSLAGALAGLALAQASLKIFDKVLSARLNMPEHLAPSPVVLAALLVLSVVSAVVFGLLPAWLAARTPIEHAMRQGQQQAGSSRKRHQLQQAMVVAEIGLSLVLLIACGLLLRTIFALRRVPLGFRTDHVLMVQPKLPRYKYRGMDLNRAVYRPLLEKIKQMNGVRSASLTTIVPLNKGFDSMVTFFVGHGEKSATPPTRIDAKLRAAGPELQEVLGFRMYQGRFFNEQDTPDSQPVVVVNRAFARLYAPDGNDVEKFSVSLSKDRQAKVVGVMDDFHQAAINEPSVPEIDFCAPQLKETDGFYQPTMQVHVELAVRTVNDPAKFIPDLRRAMAEISPDLKGSGFATMDQVVEDSMGSQLLAAHLLEIFAGAALLVALAGLYGLLSYLVAQRRQELGVRLALGAQRSSIIQLVLRQAGWMLLGGAAIGAVLAYLSSRALAGFLSE
jgi:predicted permease